MKTIIFKLLLVFAIILTGSCKKFLDPQPTDFFAPSTYYQNAEQLEFALAGVYDKLGMNRLYGAYLHTLHNMEGDEGFFNLRASLIGIQRYSFTVSDPDVLEFWKALYEGVGRANALLANVDNNSQIDEAIRNRVRGEALFLRAYYYFILVQNFENIPMYLTPVTSHEQVDVPATQAKDAYKQIISDMETAEELVDPLEKIGFGGRVSKSAVRGILARVCLNMAGYPVRDVSKYEKAKYWAQQVIEDGAAGHRLNPDYSDIFIRYARDQYDYKESIWEVEHWGNNTDPRQEAGYVGSWIGIANNATNGVGYSLGRILSTSKHYNTYEEGDLRRDWNIAPFTYHATTGGKVPIATAHNRFAGKYRREYEAGTKATQPTSINFPLLRYSDVLLMYAEAENELNPGSESATTALNQVRRRGFGKLLTGATNVSEVDLPRNLDKYVFFGHIVKERSRELCYEALRRPDLIRWGMFVETMKETLSIVKSDHGPDSWQTLTFKNASQQHVIYPIPSYELGLNKALKQHPLWK